MPNRILRDWTTSKKVTELSAECERLFTRIIMKADDYGRFYADPILIKSLCFPRYGGVTEIQILEWLNGLSKLVHFYSYEGDKYLEIIDFRQILRNKKAKFPDPKHESAIQLTSICYADDKQTTINDVAETKRREEKRIEEKRRETIPSISPTAVIVTSTNFSERSVAMIEYVKGLKNVSKMKDQLTHDEADRLIEKYPKDLLKEILLEMENYNLLTKRSRSVNLTIQNWIKRRQESNKKPHDINQNFNGITAN